MQNRTPKLLIAAFLLAIAYASFFSDWFRTQNIRIIVQNRPIPQRPDPKRTTDLDPVYPISFAFDDKYELTSLRVVKTSELRTEKFPTPLWHVISETNSRPTKAIVYGVAPAGMHPAVEDAVPQPLEAGTSYTLLIQAGKRDGSTNFIPVRAALARH